MVLLFVGFMWINNLWSQRVKMENLVVFDDKEYHFGFFFGANQMLYTINTRDNFENTPYSQVDRKELDAGTAKATKIGAAPTLGFTVGIISDLRLGKYFNLRFTPNLEFGERILNFDIHYSLNNVPDSLIGYKKRVPSTLLNFPLAIKYKGMRSHNMRPYLLVGGRVSLDLGAQASKTIEGNENVVTIKLFRDDIYAEAGFGFDFYFNWFKMSTELRMSYGLRDIILHEDNIWVGPIESMRSKVFQFNVTFE